MRLLNEVFIAALAGASVLAFPMDSVSALTLSSSSPELKVAGTQIGEVYYRRFAGGYRGGVYRGGYRGGYAYRGGYGYRRYGYGGYGYHYGYGGAAVVGGLAVGAALAAPHCWINAYGYQVCN